MITGSLQKKKGLYYAVLNLYDGFPQVIQLKETRKKLKKSLNNLKLSMKTNLKYN